MNPRAESKTGRARIGTSGYQYDHWKKNFYPEDLPKTRWFEHYARHFDTVEINNTFYRLPGVQTFERWRAAAPEDFTFALKFSRYGTHMKKLKDPEQPIEKFLESAGILEEHLGPILVQLPPGWQRNLERLDGFLRAAPKKGLRWAIEFREPSWLHSEVFELLREHGAALCIHDMMDGHPWEVTADWTYLRFHGKEYRGSYSSQKLAGLARRIRGFLEDGIDVYTFFNNDEKGYAARNAADLERYLGG